MSLENGQSLGGIYVEIGADLTQLKAGVAEARAIAENTERTVRARVQVGDSSMRAHAGGGNAYRAGSPIGAGADPFAREVARVETAARDRAVALTNNLEKALTKGFESGYRAQAAKHRLEQLSIDRTQRAGGKMLDISALERAADKATSSGSENEIGAKFNRLNYFAARMLLPGRGGLFAGMLAGYAGDGMGAVATGAIGGGLAAGLVAAPVALAATSGYGAVVRSEFGTTEEEAQSRARAGWLHWGQNKLEQAAVG